ncbi:hypothetical protein B0T10DRAFT_593289 [Thelonectria olida]|uniref:MYND-type domain-containing protein n=1 Tax=Thelonectria olida TaxID=1576542 RepID=A0A9P8VPV2_9HYPO|nr:hypothetical protein B0T10DRAFT_593289 [Thelonectria olida]
MNFHFEEFTVGTGATPEVLSEPLRPTGSPTLSEEAAFGDKHCAHCGKPHSAIWCQDCAEDNVGQLRVFYCSKSCQEQHAAAHKQICETRRRLVRAVSILREVWTTFEQETFSSNVLFVEERNREVFLRLPDESSDALNGGWTGASFLKAFPHDVLPESASNVIKKAVLFDNTCTQVLFVGLPLVNSLLKSITKDIAEASVEPKDPALVVHLAGKSLPFANHCVLRASLHTGEVFAIDLTGTQYGWMEQLYTWHTYVRHRVKHVESIGPLGGVKQLETMILSFAPPAGTGGASHTIRRNIMEGLTRSLITEFVQRRTTARDFLSLPQATFIHDRARLISHLKDFIRQEVQKLRRLGVGRLYFDHEFCPHVTLTAEEAIKYSNVWLSKEAYDANKGNSVALERMWTERMRKSRS